MPYQITQLVPSPMEIVPIGTTQPTKKQFLISWLTRDLFGGDEPRTIGSPLWIDILKILGLTGAAGVFVKVVQTIFPGGWLVKIAISIGFGVIVQWGIQAVKAIWNFDWNITDEAIEKQWDQSMKRIVTQLGATIGNLMGYVVCGFGATYLIGKINPALGLYLKEKVGEEALEEFCSNMGILANMGFRAMAQGMMMNIYKNVRYWIKEQAKNPDGWVSKTGRGIFGQNFDNMVKAWGEAGSKPWSFRKAKEDWIESINPFWQDAVEETIEEAQEACEEALLIIGWGIDEYITMQNLLKETSPLLGEEVVLQIEPDRENDDINLGERIILAGPEQVVRQSLTQTLAVHQMIARRDIGMFIGEPVREWAVTQDWEFMLFIQWKEYTAPPYGDCKKSQFHLKNVLRSKLDWQKIKTLAGGTNGYQWGHFRGRAKLRNSYPTIYGASRDICKDMLVSFVSELTNEKILTIDVTEELKEAERKEHESLYKESKRMYPAWVTIINQQKILNEEDGRTELTGVTKEQKFKLPLYTDTKPPEWDAAIAEIFRTPGPNP